MKIAWMTWIFAAMVCLLTFQESREALPDRVASRFDHAGRPTGWMAAGALPSTLGVTALGVGVLAPFLLYTARWFPPRYLNVPHADLWRRPENFRIACNRLFASGIWFGAGFLLWNTALYRLIVDANRTSPPHLDTQKLNGLIGALLVFTVGWVLLLLRSFRRPTAGRE